MNINLRKSVQAGTITTGIIIFLLTIGFTTSIAELLGEMLQNTDPEFILGFPPDAFNLLIFLAILLIWTGAASTRVKPGARDEWSSAVLNGLISGAAAGVLLAISALIFGAILEQNVQVREYLPQLSPATISLFLLGQPGYAAAVNYVILGIVSGLLGGVIGRLMRGPWRTSLNNWWAGRQHQWEHNPNITSVRESKVTRWIAFGLLVLALIWLPTQLNSYWNYVLGTVGIFALMAIGLNIDVGYAGLLDLGIVAFFAVGAYTVALLTAPEPHGLLWNFWLTIPAGIILAAAFGVLLGIPVLRLRGDYLAIVTLGMGEIIAVLINSDVLSSFTGGPEGVRRIATPTLFGQAFDDRWFLYLIFVCLAIAIFVSERIKHSRTGRALIAMREDETVARAMGINTLRYKLLAFGLGAAVAGLGGVIFASRNQFTGPEDHTLLVSINVLAVVIVGGMGNIPGIILGAFALRGLPEILRELDNYRILVFGALLVIMMIVRPAGLLPERRRKLELTKSTAPVPQTEQPPPNPIPYPPEPTTAAEGEGA